ncbi:MAG: tetratricopeptide repeat protein [Chloroflexi bacterium]|nr:tetratricopeptide repeat protein [Chloroflexota bacterium]
MLSFAEYVSALLGDDWRGQAPIGRRGMSAIFGSTVAVQDDRPEQPDSVVIFAASLDGANRKLGEGVLCTVAALAGRLAGVRSISCVSIPSALEAEYFDLGGGTTAFEEAGIGYDTIVTGKWTEESSAVTGVVLLDPDEAHEIAVVTIGDGVSLQSLMQVADEVARYAAGAESVGDAPSDAIVDGAVSIAMLQRVAELFRTSQESLTRGEGVDFRSILESSVALSVPDTLVWISAILSVSDWYEVIDLQQLAGDLMALPYWRSAAGWIAACLTQRGGVRLAIEVLEAAVGDVEVAPVSTWLALARVYGAARRPDLAIATLQSALEQRPDEPRLLRTYGQQLISSQELERVDQSAFGEDSAEARVEALEALERALRASSQLQDRLAVLFLLVQGAVDMDTDVVWEYFSLLARDDNSGRLVDSALSALLVRDDFERAVEPVAVAASASPANPRAWRNYAFAAYHAGRPNEAKPAAEKAAGLGENGPERGEAQLIAAFCESRGAEQLFSELADRIAVGREASERDLEFLEWLVESAPDHLDGYIVLARAYANQDEPSTALEVLLEAHKRIGDVPQLLNELTDLLIDDEDLSVALDYVERALAAEPQHVPSLVRAARITYLLDDLDGAKVFLRQAHTLAPYNQDVVQLTREMAADDTD